MSAFAGLADAPLWVAWVEELRGRSTTKGPYCTPTRKAESDNPATWLPRSAAEALAARIVNGRAGGVGIMLGSGRGGVDLDTCREPDSGVLQPWAEDVLRRFGSYAEVSPSARGVKLFFSYDTAALPELREALGKDASGGLKWGAAWKRRVNGSDHHPPGAECYLARRYFTATERHLAGTPLEIRPVPTETLLWLIREAGPAIARGDGEPDDATRGSAGNKRDQSRSAAAFRLAVKLIASGADYDAVVAALLANPETAEWTRTKGQADGARQLRRLFARASAAGRAGADPTESGLASVFARRHAGELLHCAATGRWHQWTGSHWREDEVGEALHLCRELANATRLALPDPPHSLSKAGAIAGIERLARVDPLLRIAPHQWNRDPWALATPGGTVDLRTGALRPAKPDDYTNKVAAVTPAEIPEHPLWTGFLEQATCGDAGLIRFLRQMAGYALTGQVSEECLFFLVGRGGNGKGVLIGALANVMGDYAVAASMETFTLTRHDRHLTELARLFGARLVTASETEQGRVWAESRIKELTGNERPIAANFMRRDQFEFMPTFKLVLIGNHRPRLPNVSHATARRFNLVPFQHQPEHQDNTLKERLRAEYPAILRWAIEGCLDWQMHGLVRPPAVLAATAEYLEEEDLVRQWIAECCVVARGESALSGDLFASWTAWALASGERPRTKKWLTGNLKRLDFQYLASLSHGYPGFAGVRIRRDGER